MDNKWIATNVINAQESYKQIKQTNPNLIISLTKIPFWGMHIAKWDKHTFLMVTQQ